MCATSIYPTSQDQPASPPLALPPFPPAHPAPKLSLSLSVAFSQCLSPITTVLNNVFLNCLTSVHFLH